MRSGSRSARLSASESGERRSGLERRDTPESNEWSQREQQRDPHADAEAEQHRRRCEPQLDIHRQEILEDPGEHELDSNAQHHASRGADQSHDRRLNTIDGQHLPTRRSETPENGDRIDLSHRERVDAARHADAAEQERDEPDDAEIVTQLLDRTGQPRLVVAGAAQRTAALRHPLVVPRHEHVARQIGRQFEQHLVLGAAPEDDELRFFDVFLGDVHARPDGRADAHVAGNALECSRNDELRHAERYRVADLSVERHEQRRIDDDVVPGL